MGSRWCDECGATMRETDGPITECVRGVRVTVDGIRHWECPECGNVDMTVDAANELSKRQRELAGGPVIAVGDGMAFHPGYYVGELMAAREMGVADFAVILKMPTERLCELVNGTRPLTVEDAAKLSLVLGTSVGYWLNLQVAFDEMVGGPDAEG